MTPAILLVTTSLYGQPASHSETRFDSMEECEDARMKVMADARIARDKARTGARALPSDAQSTEAPTPLPMVSAICVSG